MPGPEATSRGEGGQTDAPAAPGTANAPRRILIVRPTALGDVARTVPVLVSLRQAFPDAHIDWLVAKAFADAVRHHPMLDGVVEFDRKELARFGLSPASTRAGWRFAKLLRENKYDAVYDLQGLFRSGLFTRISGAPRRVGFANAREAAWLGYNSRHRIDVNIHTVDRMLALLEADGIAPVRDIQLYLADDDKAWLQLFKNEHGIGAGGYTCIAPTARWGCKCWPIERYGQMARKMIENNMAGDKLILIASPNERDQVLPIFETLMGEGASGGDVRERVVFPTTTVGQMMALLSEPRVLICNDSAPLHIAVGFNRPVVALFGPTDPALVGPYQQPDSVIRPPDADRYQANYRKHLDDPTLISKITVDEVWEKLAD